MDVHILNGNGFGGVEALFYNSLTGINPPNIKLCFLGNVPVQFKNNKRFDDLILSKADLFRNKGQIRAVIPHADYKGMALLFSLKFFLKIRIIAVSHGVIRTGTKNVFVYVSVSFIRRVYNLMLFDGKIAISNISGKDYFTGDFKVISYTPQNKSYKSRAEDFNNRPLRICCIGRFHSNWKIKSAKNQEYIFKILKRLDELKFSYEMMFIGSGHEYEYLSNKYSLKGVVNRLEYTDNDIELLCKSDLLLAPSIHESYGQAILWAQMVGTSVIVSSYVCEEVNIGGCKYLDIKDKNIPDWCTNIIKTKRKAPCRSSQKYSTMKNDVYNEYLTKLGCETGWYSS